MIIKPFKIHSKLPFTLPRSNSQLARPCKFLIKCCKSNIYRSKHDANNGNNIFYVYFHFLKRAFNSIAKIKATPDHGPIITGKNVKVLNSCVPMFLISIFILFPSMLHLINHRRSSTLSNRR